MTTALTIKMELQEQEQTAEDFRAEALEGLRLPQKTLPCKYLYDQRGSRLFDQICQLEEYYPTRTELAIMKENIEDIASVLGPNCLLVEYGSGSSLKTRLLLDHLTDIAAYVPVDISKEHLLETAYNLKEDYPDMDILPVCADFTKPFEIPECEQQVDQRIIYFPGSTIGNFSPQQAIELLKEIAVQSEDGGLLIGVDLKKDPAILKRAYNDRDGVTASFNLNLLEHINRELGADFDVDQFQHEAIYNPELGRIEMHLVSQKDQSVDFGDETITFKKGESIHTENSHKFSLEDFCRVAGDAGLQVENVWLDNDRLFSVQYLIPKKDA
ncbi:MAG: L-histidine N(alpha)-methyltransferase [Phycisphaerales bacterium]|nr:L-histidine N(alpha)-methyltransferase [Phycisphaerales bacterium]